MTSPDTSKVDMAVLALALVGEFTKVQDSIASLADVYVRRRAPGVLKYLEEKDLLEKIPDRDRCRIVLEIAKDLHTDSDLSKFGDVFHRVKGVRDSLAHSATTEALGVDTLRLTKQFWVRANRPEQPPVTVDRAQLTKMLHEARWLSQHVLFLNVKAGTAIRVYHGGIQVVILQPPADPNHWDGRVFAPVA